MSQYATDSELASFLARNDLDASTANQALTIASGLFDDASGTAFAPTTSTYTIQALGRWWVVLPFGPVISVQAVRVNGVAVTDFTQINDRLYRRGGFGVRGVFPPDRLDVDYTYGYSAATNAVKGVVLESAAMAYETPNPAVASTQIDDYAERMVPNLGGIRLSQTGEMLARKYAAAQAA